MALFHDPGQAAELKKRVQSLRADTKGKWGKMSVDQMLWHVNLPLAECLGDYTAPGPFVKGIPQGLLRWLVLNFPWGKSAPTRPDMLVKGERYDFAKEQRRCLEMIDRFASQPLDREWPRSANFGGMTGQHWSKLQWKHLNHHLKQFGV